MARSSAVTSGTVPSNAENITARPVQLRGARWSRAVLRLFGWTLQFDGLPSRQGVLVFYPHTSNWDFVLAMLAKSAIGMPARFWAKDSLFRIPLFGAWLRWLGGVPVMRHSKRGTVGEVVDRMAESRQRDEFFWLALAPEGTRSRADGWRSGFYQVALQADVPLALAYIDYPSMRLGIGCHVRLGGDLEADMALIAERLGHHRGRFPERASPVRIKS